MTTAPLPRGLRRFLAIGAVAAIAMASCGDGSTTTTASAVPDFGEIVVIAAPRNQPPTTTAPVDATPAGPSPKASRGDLRGEVRATPLSVRADSTDQRVLRVAYTGGIAPCQGARLAIDEGQATVRVVLFVGTPPEGEGVACYPIATAREVTAVLDRPLGSRELLWN